jgi:hypothetical protein
MSGMTYITTVPLKGLAIPFLGVLLSVLFELALQLSALLTISLSLGISLIFPSIAFNLALVANLLVSFNLALGLTLPSFDLKLALSIELAFVISLIVALEALLDCDLIALGWFGPGSGLGAAVSTVVPPAGTWPDGTPADDDVVAFVFAATIPGPDPPDTVSSIALVQPPPPPPTPSNPPPPAGSFPPPQSYTAGLARAVVAAPPSGGTTATCSVSVATGPGLPTGIGPVTSVDVDPAGHGSGYQSPPPVTITDAAPIVSATVATPIVVTLPDPLGIPAGVGNYLGCTITGVLGSTPIQAATATSPIIITVSSTAGITTANIPPGAYGMQGLVGTWHLKALGPTRAELWMDAAFSLPSTGTGAYVPGATLAANINGSHSAKVITSTTVELYTNTAAPGDPPAYAPVVGVGTYTGGTLAGSGTGAVANATLGGGALQTMRLFFSGMPWPTIQGRLAGGATKLSIALGGVFPLIGDLLTELQGRANALGSIDFTVTPPSVTASIELLGKISANLSANLEITPPDLSVSASATLSAQIEVIADLVARIGLYIGLDGELLVYKYEGPGSGLGPAITATLAPGWHDGTSPSAPVVAGVFGLTNPASIAAFKTFFPVAV